MPFIHRTKIWRSFLIQLKLICSDSEYSWVNWRISAVPSYKPVKSRYSSHCPMTSNLGTKLYVSRIQDISVVAKQITTTIYHIDTYAKWTEQILVVLIIYFISVFVTWAVINGYLIPCEAEAVGRKGVKRRVGNVTILILLSRCIRWLNARLSLWSNFIPVIYQLTLWFM